MTISYSRTSQTLRALTGIRQRILSRALLGGARLHEVAIAEELGISRTPVREAMGRLVAEGLLDRASGGGYRVRPYSLADAVDAIELRGLLEGAAARRAAETGLTADDRQSLLVLLGQMDIALDQSAGPDVDFQTYSDLNSAFHRAFAKASGSAFLIREIDRAIALPFAAPSAFVPLRGGDAAFVQSLIVAQAQHRALVEAICNREGARAEAIAREHVRAARRNVERHFAGGISESGAD